MARITAIWRVCSATSVLIVFEISTSAENRASTVMTLTNRPKLSVSARPGQSPGARTSGRSENPANPGTSPSDPRTSSTVRRAAAGLGSSSRRASSLAPASPLSSATVPAVA